MYGAARSEATPNDTFTFARCATNSATVSYPSLRFHSMVETTRDLYRRHSFPVFWRGLTASLLGLSHVAIQFPVYEHLKSTLSTTPDSGPRDWLVASANINEKMSFLEPSPNDFMQELFEEDLEARPPDRDQLFEPRLVAVQCENTNSSNRCVNVHHTESSIE